MSSIWKVAVLGSAVILAGCSPVRQQLGAWQGAKIDDLIAQVGPPSAVSVEMDGVRYFSWYEDRGAAYTYGGLVKLNCERTFGVDKDETITTWSWTGQCLAVDDAPWQRDAARTK